MATGLTINVSYDSSVTALQTSNPTLYADFTGAVQAAVQFYETTFSNPITITIAVGWGEVGGTTITGNFAGRSKSSGSSTHTYAQLRDAVLAKETTSTVQLAAAAALPATDPSNGATFTMSAAEARALGLVGAGSGIDGSIGLNSADTYAWTPASWVKGTKDAVGIIEHEFSEVMGRSDPSNGNYSLLDMFRYTAKDGLATDPIGAPAGVLDQPFVPGYNVNAFSYFSYDGKTVTLPYDTPTQVAAGDDIADWATLSTADIFAESNGGLGPSAISATDLQEMNTLGWDLAANAPIGIAGAVAGQTATDTTVIAPFTGVTVTDPNQYQTETVTVTPSATANGHFSNPGTGTVNSTTGAFTVSGSAAVVTQALQGLLFTPTVRQAASGQTVTTTFTIGVTDLADNTKSDTATSVMATQSPASLISLLTIKQQLEVIYLAYFNRAADGGGFNFWSGQNGTAQAGGQSAAQALTNIANSFVPQNETITLYPFLATPNPNLNTPAAQTGLAHFIGAVYGNLFGRAADTAGQSYWVGQITTGAVGLGTAALAIANGAIAGDATELLNKITVALDFTSRTSAAGLGVTSSSASLLSEAHTVQAGVDGVALNDATVASGIGMTTAFLQGGTAAMVSGEAMSAEAPAVTISVSNSLIDPGGGDSMLRFLPGVTGDTLMPRAGGVVQVEGFDPATDVVDVGTLFRDAGMNPARVGALADYVSVVDQGADAVLRFDPAGSGFGAAVVVLSGLGATVTGLDQLAAMHALRVT